MRSTRGAVVGLVAVAAAIALVVGTVACGGGAARRSRSARWRRCRTTTCPIGPIDASAASTSSRTPAPPPLGTTSSGRRWPPRSARRPPRPRRPRLRLVACRCGAHWPGGAGHHPDRLRLQRPGVGDRRPLRAAGLPDHTCLPRRGRLRRLHGRLHHPLRGRVPRPGGDRCPRCGSSRSGTSPAWGFFRPQFEEGRPVSLDHYADMVKAATRR